MPGVDDTEAGGGSLVWRGGVMGASAEVEAGAAWVEVDGVPDGKASSAWLVRGTDPVRRMNNAAQIGRSFGGGARAGGKGLR